MDDRPDEPTTEQLRAAQVERVRDELQAAEAARDPNETAQHARRADKSSYLREKLAERERSEREA
jgi:hypothetical protein